MAFSTYVAFQLFVFERYHQKKKYANWYEPDGIQKNNIDNRKINNV